MLIDFVLVDSEVGPAILLGESRDGPAGGVTLGGVPDDPPGPADIVAAGIPGYPHRALVQRHQSLPSGRQMGGRRNWSGDRSAPGVMPSISVSEECNLTGMRRAR